MDTAGKAVLFSGLTVLVSLSAVMLVPSPAFRSTSLGIIVSVLFVLAATLTLLPAVLAKLGPRVDRLSLPWVHSGEHRSPRFARWGELLWRRPYVFGGFAVVVLLALALPVLSTAHRDALDQGGAARRSVPAGLRADPGGLRAGRAGRPPDRRPGLGAPRGRDRGAGRPGHRPVPAAPAGRRRPGADRGGPDQRSVEPAARARRSIACARSSPPAR